MPDQDGEIIPADETRRILDGNPRARVMTPGGGSFAGGPQRLDVNINISGGGSDRDNLLVHVLRKALRNLGGIEYVFRP